LRSVYENPFINQPFFSLGVTALRLRTKKKSVSELSAYPKNGQCSIDLPAKNAELSASEDFHIGGWAFNKTDNSTADTLTIYFKNIKTNELTSINAQTGHKRPDVVKAFSIPSIENSGFDAVMEKDNLVAGTYEVVLLQANKDTGAIICDSEPHHITVK
jgi:hypothetical protein